MIFAIAKTHAQNYQISFAGTGASTTVDSVKVENVTQCTDTMLGGNDILHLTGTVGINELNTAADNTLHIYPNPMTGNCIIDFEAIAQGETTIGLYDITGKRILQVQELLPKGHHTYSLSACLPGRQGISSGTYTLKIESDKYSYTAKIVGSNATFGTSEIKHIETMQGADKQSAASNTGKIRGLKSGKSVIDMQFNAGDTLKLTGKSGNYRTVIMLIPTQTQTVTFTFVDCTDADGNHYAVVQIGTQLWMEENLKTTKYKNGALIPNITDDALWVADVTGAYCCYSNDCGTYNVTYGKLYNWYAVINANGICPTGWHLPADVEWTTLTTYLGNAAGGKLKEACSTLWKSPNTGATNESGFTALPGGIRGSNGGWGWNGSGGYWWSSTEYNPIAALYWSASYSTSSLGGSTADKIDGFSVRCVRD